MSAYPACKTCAFHDAVHAECRRQPPVRLPRRFGTGASPGNRVRDEEIFWGWPAVHDSDWCGEHKKVKG